ncbi:hypothetical protein [Singulisphaera sp. PoT]|uniref:hypothetical protein n=1 Tax=Singulisphaera sp. PoT TaxID=3411797 RepID=UPI003BF4CE9E
MIPDEYLYPAIVLAIAWLAFPQFRAWVGRLFTGPAPKVNSSSATASPTLASVDDKTLAIAYAVRQREIAEQVHLATVADELQVHAQARLTPIPAAIATAPTPHPAAVLKPAESPAPKP